MAIRKTSAPAQRIPKKTPDSDVGKSAAERIAQRIDELGDWRGALLGRLRVLIRSAHPSIREEWKWNVPVWSCEGIICTGEAYKRTVKLTFAKGASLPDPSHLFNSSLEGNTRRAIDFLEDSEVREQALVSLVRAAAALNQATAEGKAKGAA